ncbi:hypothetical protein HT105_23865, partial [Bacteroides fragilis]|nr:hypothetical protein [Bacteroides fragilis]
LQDGQPVQLNFDIRNEHRTVGTMLGHHVTKRYGAAGLPQAHHPIVTATQDHGLDRALDNSIIQQAAPALQDGQPVQLNFDIRNEHRTVGTMLGHHVTKRYG